MHGIAQAQFPLGEQFAAKGVERHVLGGGTERQQRGEAGNGENVRPRIETAQAADAK